MTRLSPHFTLEELTLTQVRDVDNTPDADQVQNLRRLAGTVLEPLRLEFGPYVVSSGYRSRGVNERIGGSKTSAHMDGRAVDGAPLKQLPWRDVMAFALERLPVDQAIYEFGEWLHFGIAKAGAVPRGQGLMIFSAGRYETWAASDPRVTR